MENKIVYSVVVPVYNAAPALEELHRRLVKVMESLGGSFEVIFVEDAGKDHSWEVLKKISAGDGRVMAIRFMRNFGQSCAVMCGMMQSSGEYVITIDDDLQNPPEEIPNLVRSLQEMPDADVAMGVPKEKKHSFFRRVGSSLVEKMNSRIFKRDPSIKLSSFRVIRRRLADQLRTFHLLGASIDALICAVTSHIVNVRVEHRERERGRSGYTVWRLLQQTLNNFIGFSVFPLRLMALLGLTGIFASLLYGVYLLYNFLFVKNYGVPGWLSIVFSLNFLSGFTFFSFGIVGEYLLKILHCTSRGSSFFIKEIVRRP